eukprot:scaffold150462_cov16-Tisochrysis_lutea.AAC.1
MPSTTTHKLAPIQSRGTTKFGRACQRYACKQQGKRQLCVVPRAAATTGGTVAGGKARPKQPGFPFTKIQGQDDMKLALLLNVVDPNIGGALIMGDRGCGKSVAVSMPSSDACINTLLLMVRALVDLLPDIEVVVDDPFNSDPKDPKYMGPEVLQRFRNGEQLPTTVMRTPL